jgi:hypothetical protein
LFGIIFVIIVAGITIGLANKHKDIALAIISAFVFRISLIGAQHYRNLRIAAFFKATDLSLFGILKNYNLINKSL